jgi:hypothetical protein
MIAFDELSEQITWGTEVRFVPGIILDKEGAFERYAYRYGKGNKCFPETGVQKQGSECTFLSLVSVMDRWWSAPS